MKYDMKSEIEKDIYYLVGQNIKKQRKLKGLTQKKLAEITYYSYEFVRKIESRSACRNTFSLDTVDKIANAISVKNPPVATNAIITAVAVFVLFYAITLLFAMLDTVIYNEENLKENFKKKSEAAGIKEHTKLFSDSVKIHYPSPENS